MVILTYHKSISFGFFAGYFSEDELSLFEKPQKLKRDTILESSTYHTRTSTQGENIWMPSLNQGYVSLSKAKL